MRMQYLSLPLLAVRCIADPFATGDTKMSKLFKVHSTCWGYDGVEHRLDSYLAQLITLLDSCLGTFDILRNTDQGLNFAKPETRNLASDAWFAWGVADLQAEATVKDERRKIAYGEDNLNVLKIARDHLGRVQKIIQDGRAAAEGKKTRLLCSCCGTDM